MRDGSSVISASKFARDQTVEFIGGRGKIRNHHYESGSWFYRIEMPLGPKPGFGRIGGETGILLPESDIISLTHPNAQHTGLHPEEILENKGASDAD